jgi:hypothetical protein
LQLQLLQWLQPDEVADASDAPGTPRPAAATREVDALRRLDEDPKLRQQVAEAMGKAADELGLGSRAEIVGLFEQLAGELSYIEALRDTLLRRVRATMARIERLAGNQRAADAQRMEPMNQVRRLTGHALIAISRRFDQVDAQTGEVLATLRNLERQRAFIRANRDWLYRCLRAWEPILAEWDNAGMTLDDWTWGLIGRTYQFLAPRYMPMTEWLTVGSRLGKRAPWVKSRSGGTHVRNPPDPPRGGYRCRHHRRQLDRLFPQPWAACRGQRPLPRGTRPDPANDQRCVAGAAASRRAD